MASRLISVLIDTFNHEKFIERAVDSVLSQRNIDHACLEIIVVDDGSVDGTPRLLRRYERWIRIHRKSNQGQASAFNEGIRLCQGEIIAFLDGDDWWHDDKLSRVITTFEERPDVCAVGHGIIVADEVAGFEKPHKPSTSLTLHHDRLDGVPLFHSSMSYLGTSRLAARTEVLLSLLDVPPALVFEADEYLFTLLPACGPVLVLPECLTYYRIHGENLFQESMTREGMADLRNPRLEKRARVFECLSETLYPALLGLKCDEALANQLLKPTRLKARRLKFMTSGGSRWNNFGSELAAIQSKEVRWQPIEIAVAFCTLFLAALLSPRSFFRLRTTYSGSLFRRVRDRLSSLDSQW
jgi:glycosyltransferase involved in cell wall biosynthesis